MSAIALSSALKEIRKGLYEAERERERETDKEGRAACLSPLTDVTIPVAKTCLLLSNYVYITLFCFHLGFNICIFTFISDA